MVRVTPDLTGLCDDGGGPGGGGEGGGDGVPPYGVGGVGLLLERLLRCRLESDSSVSMDSLRESACLVLRTSMEA